MSRWKEKRHKRIPVIFMLTVLIITMMVPITSYGAGVKSYQVIFRAGSHGTLISGDKSLTTMVPYMDTIHTDTYQYLISPERGYYFTGWSPNQGTITITNKTTLVAQYARIIDEAVYQVNYVDIYGNQLLTPKVVTTQAGAAVTEAALEMEGYGVDAAIKTLDKNNEITFIYTPLNVPGREIITETVVLPGGTTVTTVVLPQTTAAAGGGGAAPGAVTPAADEAAAAAEAGAGEVIASDEPTPLENQELPDDVVQVPDENVPQALTILGNPYLPWIIGLVVLLVIVGGVIFAVRKMKK